MGRWLRKLSVWLLVVLAAGLFYVDRTVQVGFGDRSSRAPVRFYAAPREISIGLAIEEAGVFEELEALEYQRVPGEPVEPGTFRFNEDLLEVHLRPANVADSFGLRPARRVRVALQGGRVRSILDAEQGEVASVALEARPLDGSYQGHWTSRRPLRLEDVPANVVDAVLAAEDARFLDHIGVDFGSLMRAFRVNWRAGEVKQGGSTITQQFIKNHFLSPERTLWRKAREIPLALALERRYSKREILEAYLARVYLGHDRLVGIHGFAEGAWVFFGKPVSELTLGEGATLAGIIRAPNVYSPLRHPARAMARRDEVLERLVELGWAKPEEVRQARQQRPGQARVRDAASEAYFVQFAAGELEEHELAPGRLEAGTDVFTTIDSRLQKIVTEEVRRAADRMGGAQIAVVAMDPMTGALRAIAGGRDYLESQYDRASRIRRPVGSMFKPFVALAALEDSQSRITAATRLEDEPLKVGEGRSAWEPRNNDDRFRGSVTLREALSESLNVPMVRLAQRLGVERLAGFGDRLAFREEPLPRLPSIALGAFESSLLAMVSAYTIFPGGGVQVRPFAIESVKAPSGVIVHQAEASESPIASPEASYVVHTMLEDVVDGGTASRLRTEGVPGAFAGKTGTTSDQRDAWFVGYTPSLVLGVWVGFDDDQPLPGSATQLAVPLWGAIAGRAFAGTSLEDFHQPAGVDRIDLDDATGLRAGPACRGSRFSEVFVPGTGPTDTCALP